MNINDQIKAIIFDLDGTLIDTLPSLANAVNALLLASGHHAVETSVMRPALNNGLLHMVRFAIEIQSTPVPHTTALMIENRFLGYYAQHWLQQACTFPYVQQTLQHIHDQDYLVALCTNRDRHTAQQLLQRHDIAHLFDALVCIDDIAHPKPHPEPLLKAMHMLSISKKQALFVGDSALDAQCAKACDVSFAAYLNGYATDKADLHPSVFTFDAYDQFQHHLSRIAIKEPING